MARALVIALCLLALGGCASGGGAATATTATPATPEVGGMDAAALLELERNASRAYGDGRDAEATTLYLALTRAVPAEPSYWYRLANVLVRSTRYDDAAIAYQQALTREPANARAWHNLGIVRLRQAQESFAEGVKRSSKGDAVFEQSLRLSTSLYSLTSHGTVDTPDAPRPAAPAPVPATAPPAATPTPTPQDPAP